MDSTGQLKQEKYELLGNHIMKIIVKPTANTLTQIEVTTSDAREKELLGMGEEVYKFLNPDNRVVISSKGKVLVKENKGFYRLVKTFKDLNGHDCVNLQNRTYLVHSLVAESFLGTPSGLLSTIKHVNGDKSDNSVSNLKYSSPEEEWRNIRAVKPHTGESALFSNFQVAMPFIRGLNGTIEEVVKAIEKQKKYRSYYWTGDKIKLP